jgi:hypothetical protein
MKSLSDHIVENANTRGARKKLCRIREVPGEDGEAVRMISSLGLNAATVALPAGIDLETRAERMNQFWCALAEFQDRDVLVVALCVGDDHPR